MEWIGAALLVLRLTRWSDVEPAQSDEPSVDDAAPTRGPPATTGPRLTLHPRAAAPSSSTPNENVTTDADDDGATIIESDDASGSTSAESSIPIASLDPVVPSTAPLATTEPSADALRRWATERRTLVGLLATSSVLAGIGLAMTFIPMAVLWGDEDGTEAMSWVAGGATALVIGGVGVTALAPVLGHHQRWDHPTMRARSAAPHEAHRARLHVRRLYRGLGISAGVAVSGGLAVGLGFAAASTCAARDHDCSGSRVIGGAVTGGLLVSTGVLAAAAMVIAIALQKRHGHTEPSRGHLAISSRGVAVRF